MLKPYTERLAPYAPVLLRLIVGITFIAHGFQKLQHPASFIGLMGLLKIPLSPVSGWFIILLETVGGLFMILGVGTRWLGILFAIEMAVTTLLVKLSIGFIAPPGTRAVGYELDLLLLATSLALVLLGSGPFSLEQNVLKRARARKSRDLSA
jgi:putative oxidoreductase